MMDNSDVTTAARCVFSFCNTHEENDFEPYPHSHPCVEIVYAGKVCGWMFEDDRRWRYTPGQVVVYQPGPRHWSINDKDRFGYHLCLGVTGGCSALIPADVYDADKDLMLLFTLVQNALASPVDRATQQARLDLLAGLVCLSLQEIARKAAKEKKMSRVTLAKQMLDTEFMKPVTIDEIASRIFVSGDHLRHLFRKEFGIGPIHYLLRKRVEHAQTLLRGDKQRKIYEVAKLCGFADPYYFSRIFKKVSGQSPEQYRAGLEP